MIDDPTGGIRESLRRVGVKVTSPRARVLERLRHRPHSTADELLEWAGRSADPISRQGMYDVLGTLVEAGLARRIEPAGHPSRYEIRVGDNHHHVVCRGCGAIADVDCAVGAMPCLEPSSGSGFTIEEAEITFWGTCPACRSAGAAARESSQRSAR